MSDVMECKARVNEWVVLIGDTRLALSRLYAEDIEELRARAECMLSATFSHDSIRQNMALPRGSQLLDATREHRLLHELLAATKDNIRVLRRTPGNFRATVGEASSRWER
jgi:hypothetical protein